MKQIMHKWKLSTGREMEDDLSLAVVDHQERIRHGVVSHEPGFELREGYDCVAVGRSDSPLTPTERQEIAMRMIAKWVRWAAGEEP